MNHRRIFALVGTVAAAASVSAIAPAVGAAATGSRSVTIAATFSPQAARTPRVGSVPASAAVSFEVDLKLVDPAAAARLAAAVSSPASSSYGHYLTPAQWERRFSPTARQVAEVTDFLRAHGFQVTGVSADRMAIDALGSAGLIERVFRTSLSYHRVQGHRVRLADRALSVPASLGSVILAVNGVSQVLAHPDDVFDGPKTGPGDPGYPQPPGFRAAHPCGSFYGQLFDATRPPFGGGYSYPAPYAVCGYTPPQFRSAYGLSGGPDGTGATVAVVDAYASPTIFSDAQHFSALNDPGHTLAAGQFSQLLSKTFNQGDACGANGWWGEESLDVEAVHGTAPGANILFAGAENCGEIALNGMVRRIVDHHLAQVITNSYGDNGGDVLDPASVRESVDNVLMMAAGTGVSVLFSSGDNGDEYTTIGSVVADYPPSSPWATAVGGTTLQIGAAGQRLGEFGWSTARSFLCNDTYIKLGSCTPAQQGTWLPIDLALGGGSGGGTSQVYPQPDYQTAVVPASLAEMNGPTPMRVEPDISMEADPATGMLVGETQTFPNGVYYDQYRIGGTSVSSPLFAGVVARADSAAGHALGFLNPALYSLHGNRDALDDILPAGKQDMSRADYANSITPFDGYLFTTRIIDYEGQEQFCEPSGACRTRDVAIHAAPGYDDMTGLGSPGAGFVRTLGSLR